MSIHCTPMRYRLLFIALPVLASMILAGAAGYAISALNAKKKSQHTNEHLVQWAQDIAKEQVDLILKLSVTDAPCSDEDITVLRRQMVASKYVGDIARIHDGALRCSAVWGHWRKPYVLPAGGKEVRHGILLWKNLPGPHDSLVAGDVAANGSVAIFTGPAAYRDVGGHLGPMRARAFSRDGRHVYWSFDTTSASAPDAGFLPWLKKQSQVVATTTTCAKMDDPDICVASTASIDARQTLLLAALAGLVLGAAIGAALLLWWRGSFGLRASLVEALRRRKICIEYQPLKSLASGEVKGAEALARWTHDEVGPIPPDTFVSWIESMGLRQTFTRYVVQSALDGARDLLAGPTPFNLSVNVFPGDLEDVSFLGFLVEAVNERCIDPGRVILEVTESAQFASAAPDQLFQRFREAGFKIFLDDFGAGYSNLGNIVRWDVDGIKLDKFFVQSIGQFAGAAPVLDQVIEMTRQLDLLLVVEGIETQEQADFVRQRSSRAIGQGWLLGRPGPASQLRADAGPLVGW